MQTAPLLRKDVSRRLAGFCLICSLTCNAFPACFERRVRFFYSNCAIHRSQLPCPPLRDLPFGGSLHVVQQDHAPPGKPRFHEGKHSVTPTRRITRRAVAYDKAESDRHLFERRRVPGVAPIGAQVASAQPDRGHAISIKRARYPLGLKRLVFEGPNDLASSLRDQPQQDGGKPGAALQNGPLRTVAIT